MSTWLIPALKAVLPHIGTIVATAAPVFTRKKVDTAADQTLLLQQQITELQVAVSQNATHIKDLAAQLQGTVTALEQAAPNAEKNLRRMLGFSIVAIVFSALALSIVLIHLLTR